MEVDVASGQRTWRRRPSSAAQPPAHQVTCKLGRVVEAGPGDQASPAGGAQRSTALRLLDSPEGGFVSAREYLPHPTGTRGPGLLPSNPPPRGDFRLDISAIQASKKVPIALRGRGSEVHGRTDGLLPQ